MVKKLKKMKEKVMPGVIAATTALAVPTSALAVTVNSNADFSAVGGSLLDTMFTIAQFLGGALVIWGGIQFGLSISQENPDQRSRALLQLFAGAIVVGLKPLLTALGVIS